MINGNGRQREKKKSEKTFRVWRGEQGKSDVKVQLTSNSAIHEGSVKERYIEIKNNKEQRQNVDKII